MLSGWMVVKAVHILAGTFWVGGAALVTAFLLPAAKATGPAAGIFMGNLMQRYKLPVALNLASWVAILSGLVLYWRFSAGFEQLPLNWPGGIGIFVGSVMGILAFLWGSFYQSPRAKRLGAILAGLQGPPSPEQAALIQGLQRKIYLGGWFGVSLLILSVIGMTMMH